MSDEPKDGSKVELEERQLYAFRYVPDHAVNPPKEWPFACILALRQGERVVNGQWCCLHAFIRRDGTFEYSEGLFGTDTEVTCLYRPIWWPEMAKALAVIPQPYKGPFGRKKGELPFDRVARWHRHGYSHPQIDPDAEGRVLKALRVNELWDKWMERKKHHKANQATNWNYVHCLTNSGEPGKLAVSKPIKDADGNALKQFCHNLGLHPDYSANFKTRMRDLEAVLDDIRRDYQVTYLKQQAR